MPYIGKQPLTGAYQLCDTITTSATATYNLLVGGSAVIPGSANNCIVSLNGVVQAPVGAFTVSGSTITFASTLSATDVIDFILILGNVFDIGTPTNGAVTNSSLNSNVITGQTAETTVAGGDLVLLYDDSASALRKMTRTNFVSGLGITEADQWRINLSTTFTGLGNSDVTSNWERADSDGFDKIGTGLSESSGIFSFPSTGYYYIHHTGSFFTTASRLYLGFNLYVTLDNSSYSDATSAYSNTHTSSAYATTSGSFIIKVTDTANIKFKFLFNRNNTAELLGGTINQETGFTCIKLAGI